MHQWGYKEIPLIRAKKDIEKRYSTFLGGLKGDDPISFAIGVFLSSLSLFLLFFFFFGGGGGIIK